MDPTLSIVAIGLVPENLRCKYPSKRCESVRVLKRDGELHRFCEFHRLKANLNQQRLEQRRKMAHLSTPGKRVKRNRGDRSPTSVDAEPFELPTLDAGDLDLDLLGDLLVDVPAPESLDVDDTLAALHLLDASFDPLRVTVRW